MASPDIPPVVDVLAHTTIAHVKETAKKHAIIQQLFPQLNDSLDMITEENMPEDIQMFLRPDDAARARYAQMAAANPDGYASTSDMLYAITGNIPTPEHIRDIEWFMDILIP